MGDEKRKPPMYYPQWCREVKIAMYDMGVSGPKALAKELGYSRSHVTQAVNGRIPVSDDLIDRISIFLGVRSPTPPL